ncbi:MAG: hypothetical protein E7598_07405 [Ruminococcaceae bacterium]|nr:hypothetical protein [Oscillospiraceae bacterium]
MKEIIIILLCVPLYVINSFCDKYVSSKSLGKGYTYNTLKFLIGSICFLPMLIFDAAPKFAFGVMHCGVLCGIMYAVSKTIILKGYETSSVAFMTLCHSAGMIIPCVIGYLFWNEKLSIFAFVGIMMTVFSAVLIKGGDGEKKGYSAIGIIIGIAVFVTSGGVMICQKLMGIYFPMQSVGAYNFYSFFVPCILLGIFTRKEKPTVKGTKSVLPFAIGSALSLCVISFVMTSLAGKVPSVIMFPLFNGIGIILVCIGSVFAFKEKMTVKKAVGLCIGILGMCLVNFK